MGFFQGGVFSSDVIRGSVPELREIDSELGFSFFLLTRILRMGFGILFFFSSGAIRASNPEVLELRARIWVVAYLFWEGGPAHDLRFVSYTHVMLPTTSYVEVSVLCLL